MTGASTTQPTGIYGAGNEIAITLDFNEAVTVTGTPQLALNDGGVASYSGGNGTTGGSGTWQLTFTYVVSPGQATPNLDYASTAALSLNGGTIQDFWGNAAVLTLPATGTNGLATTQIAIAPTLTLTSADWTPAGLTVTLRSDGKLHVYITGTPTDAVPPVAVASVGNISINAPSSTAAYLTIDSTAGTPIPAGGLSYGGGGGLIKTGSGSVTLSGTNSYTGGTTVAAGTLVLTDASAIATGTKLTVGADAGLFLNSPGITISSGVVAAALSGDRHFRRHSERHVRGNIRLYKFNDDQTELH